MARKIDSLLNKKGWTGIEVGKALIASTIHDVKHQRDPDFKPLFSQSDFDKMESSLSTERDYTVYGVYRDLYSSIIDAYNRGQGLFQQFYNGYSRYSNTMYLCQQSDEALKRAESYPLIMTESQYNRYKAMAEERLKGYEESFYSLLFHVLEKFIDAPEEAPEPIRELIEATKKETATNQRILGAYNEDYGLGYYTLPDGRRSDKMTAEEWQKALKELFLKTHSLTVNGQPATAEETYQHYNNARLLKAYELFYLGIDAIKALYKDATGEEMDGVDAEEETRLMDALGDIIEANLKANEEQKRKERGDAPLYPLQGFINALIDGTTESATEWHYYEEAPELTKYQVLTDCLERYNGAVDEDLDEKAQLKEFKADYPELFKALEAYIKEAVPALQRLKPAQYFKEVISWGELAELGVIGYKSLVEASEGEILETLANDDSISYIRRRRYGRKGIAIIKNPRAWQVDTNGDYLDDTDPISVFTSLDDIAEDEQKHIELDAYQNNLFKPALRFMYAYNALMLIIGNVYDIPDTEALQLPVATFESQLKSFNNLIYIFYADVYGDEAEKTRKRAIIKAYFPPVDIEELKPTKEAIDAVTTELVGLGLTTKARKNLKNFDRFIALLMGEGA